MPYSCHGVLQDRSICMNVTLCRVALWTKMVEQRINPEV